MQKKKVRVFAHHSCSPSTVLYCNVQYCTVRRRFTFIFSGYENVTCEGSCPISRRAEFYGSVLLLEGVPIYATSVLKQSMFVDLSLSCQDDDENKT